MSDCKCKECKCSKGKEPKIEGKKTLKKTI